MSVAREVDTYPSVESLLRQALGRIQVLPTELAEAKRRRKLIADLLREAFPGSRTYNNGSVAHGDALTPLLDVDLGVVVPDPEHQYGPGGVGPQALKERAATAVREGLREEFGDLRVEVEGHKRSVLVRFNDPMRPGWEDFTADIIIAVDNPDATGLFIPRHDTWDRSHPEKHTALIVEAIALTDVTYARVVRLLKHWVRQFDDAPMCSWHVKALALGILRRPVSLSEGLLAWFHEAADGLEKSDTPDPAGVGPVIKTPGGDRYAVAAQLKQAGSVLARALQFEQDGWPALAHDELAELFGDEQMLPHPEAKLVAAENATRLSRRRGPGLVVVGPTQPQVRSWHP